MNAKKILLKAATTQKQRKEIQRMTEAEAVDLLRSLSRPESGKKEDE